MLFQVGVAPNGLAVEVHGPEVGRHNDKFAQLRSLNDQRLGMLFGYRGFAAYGDSIYNVTPFVVTAVAGLVVPVPTRSQNRALNRGRVEVEHFFRHSHQLVSLSAHANQTPAAGKPSRTGTSAQGGIFFDKHPRHCLCKSNRISIRNNAAHA